LDTSAPIKDDELKPKRKPPIWPWLVLLVLTLMVIYAYDQTLEVIDDLRHTGRDFAQLFKWLWSLAVQE
jgi:hypothetical protein